MATKNYTLGRGKVSFARYKPGTRIPDGFHYFGNTPEFNLSFESEMLDHFSSEEGIREKDDSMTLEVTRSGSLTTDNITPENVAFFFFGESLTITSVGSSGEAFAFEGVRLGHSYKVGVTAENPAGDMGIENVTGTGLTEGTDFSVNRDAGLITFLEGGSVQDGDDVSGTYDVAGHTRSRVISGTDRIEGAMLYETKNPKGEDCVFYMPYVTVMPNGDYALKGDEWQSIPLSIEILKPENAEAVYGDGKPAYTG